jgi:hypothetical protein
VYKVRDIAHGTRQETYLHRRWFSNLEIFNLIIKIWRHRYMALSTSSTIEIRPVGKAVWDRQDAGGRREQGSAIPVGKPVEICNWSQRVRRVIGAERRRALLDDLCTVYRSTRFRKSPQISERRRSGSSQGPIEAFHGGCCWWCQANVTTAPWLFDIRIVVVYIVIRATRMLALNSSSVEWPILCNAEPANFSINANLVDGSDMSSALLWIQLNLGVWPRNSKRMIGVSGT